MSKPGSWLTRGTLYVQVQVILSHVAVDGSLTRELSLSLFMPSPNHPASALSPPRPLPATTDQFTIAIISSSLNYHLSEIVQHCGLLRSLFPLGICRILRAIRCCLLSVARSFLFPSRISWYGCATARFS